MTAAESADEKPAQLSIDAGVLESIEPPEYVTIDVVGKTPDDVCDIIVDHVGPAAQLGCVIVLCGQQTNAAFCSPRVTGRRLWPVLSGLSGTGKGTTVAKLREKLPNTVTWSNGNVFRSITLLACKWCETNGVEDIEAALTAENLASLMTMLSFDKYD
jgi:hypothetical protein